MRKLKYTAVILIGVAVADLHGMGDERKEQTQEQQKPVAAAAVPSNSSESHAVQGESTCAACETCAAEPDKKAGPNARIAQIIIQVLRSFHIDPAPVAFVIEPAPIYGLSGHEKGKPILHIPEHITDPQESDLLTFVAYFLAARLFIANELRDINVEFIEGIDVEKINEMNFAAEHLSLIHLLKDKQYRAAMKEISELLLDEQQPLPKDVIIKWLREAGCELIISEEKAELDQAQQETHGSFEPSAVYYLIKNKETVAGLLVGKDK